MKVCVVILAILAAASQNCGVLCSSHHTTLTLNRAGRWGDWGPKAFCPSGTFAYAFELKVEGSQGRGDDTAMNGIRLYCGRSSRFSISSTVQKWGDWRGQRACSQGYLTGLRMKSEGSQGDGDDTAANDLQMQCNWSTEAHYGGGTGWGHWSRWEYCPSAHAICGLRTLVEREGGDDTALNDVHMYCCEQ